MKAIAEGVSAASQQQAQGVRQVTTAIQEMEKVTQTTAATAEESAAASEELNAQAEVTMQLVEGLEMLVGGNDVSGNVAMHTRNRAARPAPNVVKMAPAPKPRKGPATPEDVIPLDDEELNKF